MDNENRTPETPEAQHMGATASVIVAGIFVICMVFFTGKVVFASNAETAPSGLDTATINTDIAEPEPAETTTAVTAPVDGIISDDSGADDSSAAEEEDEPEESLGTMYITEYAYLRTQPDKESENIVCMSPGIGVQVLNYEDNGYVKVTFQYLEGPLTGYVYRDYLSEYQTVVPSWEQ